MTHTQQHMLPVCTYKLRNPASFRYRPWSVKESGFLSLVYMCVYSIYTNTKVTYVHIRNLMSLSSNFIYVHVNLLPTYIYLYVTYINIHMWKIHMWYVYLYHYDCTWHMSMYICTYVTYMHIYMCLLPTYI